MTQMLTAYFAERERAGGQFLAEAMLDLFEHRGVQASVMLRGIASFGPANIIRGDRKLSLSEDPPVTISAVGTTDQMTALLDEVSPLMGRGVLTVQPAAVDTTSDWVRLTLYSVRRHTPDHVAACAVLHRSGFAAAEVFLGVDGTVSGQRRRARFFSRNGDVPLLVSGVGTAAQAAAATAEWRGMLPDALITAAPVQVCKDEGRTRAGPGETDGYLKLTVRTAEGSRFDGQPIHRALIRRLKDSDHASGATALRGFWGFRGAQPPHGDRVLQLSRRVPVSTVTIDTAANIAASYAIVDELTTEAGLVTVETVPTVVIRHGEQTLRVG